MAPESQTCFWTVYAVAGPGWDRGRLGTKWHRVPLKIQQSEGLLFLGVPGCEVRSVSLIGGADFDSVGVTVWSYRILLESGGPGRCCPARLLFTGKLFGRK